MTERVNPKIYGLPPKTVLEELDYNTIALVINRKSRIIMADGNRILQKISKIKAVEPDMKVIFKTTAPICSKTRTLLENSDIHVILK